MLMQIKGSKGRKEMHFDYKDELLDDLITALNEITCTKTSTSQSKKAAEEKKSLLLALDNVEDIINHDGKKFRQMIQDLLTDVKDMQIILGSTRNIGTSEISAVGNL